jgi:outer membrane protein OmpA-like peptidoglycan-associated protein
MALNLVDSVKNLFTPDLVTQTATSLGESEGAIQKAINGAIPASLVGILNKAGSGGATNLLNMARQASETVPNNLRSLLGGTGIASLLSMAGGLFGDRLNNIVRNVATFAGIRESSASSIMNLAAPVALASLGREASATNMNPTNVVSMLNNQKDTILSSVPPGLNLASALGLGSLSEIGTKLSNVMAGLTGSVKRSVSYAGEAVERKVRTNWFLPFLLILALGIGAWYLLGRGCNTADTAVSDTDTRDTITKYIPDPVVAPPARESYRVKLPDGTELDAWRGGIEDRLVAYLNTNWIALGDDSLKNTWFDFDDLNFETGSATLTPASMKQVRNIVAIMKAYPEAKFKIGGYTDRVGNDADNKKLSQQRADAVAAALKKEGADAKRIVGAEGYGEDYATVPETATDEERRKDRRIAISVRR